MKNKETQAVLQELKKMGAAQNRKIYSRHGVVDEQYGVSSANLGILKKRIKTNHPMALTLWETGNHDARVLACMIADSERMKGPLLNAWVKDLNNYVLTRVFSELASQSPRAIKYVEKWIKAKSEWICSAGWNVLSHLVMADETFSNELLENYLNKIEAGIHTSQNRVKYSMNNTLIAIGIRNPVLQKKALAAAKRIGKVEVNHGETSCKTPGAAAYIKKTVERKKKK